MKDRGTSKRLMFQPTFIRPLFSMKGGSFMDDFTLRHTAMSYLGVKNILVG